MLAEIYWWVFRDYGGTSGIKGNVSQSVQSDKDATKLWDSIKKTIGSLVRATVSSSTSASSAPGLPGRICKSRTASYKCQQDDRGP